VGEGHVYQDRFKSFPVESDGHLLTLGRYVERNARRAGLVERAEDWRWSGLWRRQHGCDDWLLSTWPVPRPEDWLERVNEPLTSAELTAIRQCLVRGSPFGSSRWTRQIARKLGLQHTLRATGRPRIASSKSR
jgi:putative transposase